MSATSPIDPNLADFLSKLSDDCIRSIDLELDGFRIQRCAAIVLLVSSHRRRTFHKQDGTDYSVDAIEDFRDVFVPSEIARAHGMESFEPQFEEHVPEVPAPWLECKDLRPVPESSAYRGAMRTVDPRFHGFDFRDTIELAIAGLRGFLSWRGKELGRSIRAFAWPFVWLTCDGRPESAVVMPTAPGDLFVIKSA